jgi:hypothetical protein
MTKRNWDTGKRVEGSHEVPLVAFLKFFYYMNAEHVLKINKTLTRMMQKQNFSETLLINKPKCLSLTQSPS